jgi:hypothetical protein
MTREPKPKQPTTWRRPTRRAFVAMLGAAAATLALREKRKLAEPLRTASTAPTRWIGHC